jgi:hypothetical protein
VSQSPDLLVCPAGCWRGLQVLALLTSGLTASIALLDTAGMPQQAGSKPLRVLVTAAAGGEV